MVNTSLIIQALKTADARENDTRRQSSPFVGNARRRFVQTSYRQVVLLQSENLVPSEALTALAIRTSVENIGLVNGSEADDCMPNSGICVARLRDLAKPKINIEYASKLRRGYIEKETIAA